MIAEFSDSIPPDCLADSDSLSTFRSLDDALLKRKYVYIYMYLCIYIYVDVPCQQIVCKIVCSLLT